MTELRQSMLSKVTLLVSYETRTAYDTTSATDKQLKWHLKTELLGSWLTTARHDCFICALQTQLLTGLTALSYFCYATVNC